MFKCGEFASTYGREATISAQPLFGNKHGISSNKRQRKFVSGKSGLVGNTILLLVLFLFLSIHCIGLAQCGQVSPSSVPGLGKASSSSSGKEGGNSRGSSVGAALDDGELSSSHHHNYHRHHRHSSSGKNLPQSSSSSATSASYGYQPEHSPLSYYNPDAYYEPRYYDRPSREFSARSTSYPALAAVASTSQVGFAEPEYGGLALASGHGGGHGHSGGHSDSGYGHGHHTTYYKTVNKLDQSSLGLLGLLGLLSLLSNVLMLLTTTARTTSMMPMGMVNRLKRDTMMLVKLKEEEISRSQKSVVERLSRLILPSLNVVGHAKDGRIPLNCTYQEVCKTNKALVQVFGADEGRPVASVLSTAITKLLTNNANGDRNVLQGHHHHHHHNSDRLYNGNAVVGMTCPQLTKKLLMDAGAAGRNGEDCELHYPTCDALSDTDDYSTNGIKRKGSFRLPFLISPEHALAIILGQKRT